MIEDDPGTDPTRTATVLRIGLVLTLIVLLIGSVRFARYDWTGLRLDRAPATDVRRVSNRCVERIEPYVTESGRTISPVVVDEQQYLSMVEYFRGTPRSQLAASCLYRPFTGRAGVPWLAHWIPGDEGRAIGIVNTALLLTAVWAVLLALRAQRVSPRALLLAATLFSVGWNPFFFGTALLVDVGAVAAIAICWYLLARGLPWLVAPALFLAYPLKETVVIIVPVALVWAFTEVRAGRLPVIRAWGPAGAIGVAAIGATLAWPRVLPAADATWDLSPALANVGNNLFDLIGLASFVIAVGPLLVPAALGVLRSAARRGWLGALVDPAVVGVLGAAAVTTWAVLTAALSPRMMWIGLPFAATLAARWFDAGPLRSWMDRLALPRWLIGAPPDGATTVTAPEALP